jgi:hypothetical protein
MKSFSQFLQEASGPTRKHFQQVADLIKTHPNEKTRKELALHHASIFATQNPRFDKKKFLSSANVTEETIKESDSTHKHFQQTADHIRQELDIPTRMKLAKSHADVFGKANPRFDKKKFYTAAGVAQHGMNETTINELSGKTLKNYVNKAAISTVGNMRFGKSHPDASKKDATKEKRLAGITKAAGKLKEQVVQWIPSTMWNKYGQVIHPDYELSIDAKGNRTAVLKTIANKTSNKKKNVVKEDADPLDVPTPTVEAIAKKHNVPVEQIEAQLKKGIEVETEHTTDADVAKEIALDHLNEKPDYYTQLAKVESVQESTHRRIFTVLPLAVRQEQRRRR